jgi:hypothetical protein
MTNPYSTAPGYGGLGFEGLDARHSGALSSAQGEGEWLAQTVRRPRR